MTHKNEPNKPSLRLVQSEPLKLPPQTSEEWLLVSFEAPDFVIDDGTPFRPILLAWLDEEGFIVGTSAVHPNDVEDALAGSFVEVTLSPGMGEARRPKCVFVADRLYKAAKSTLTGIVVERAPKGVAEEAAEQLQQSFSEHLDENDDGKVGPQSFLDWGLDEKDVAAFFFAMADLYEIRPWDLVPTAEDVLGVWLPAPYNKTFPVCVMGQGGETFGLLIFENEADSQDYLDAVKEKNGDHLPYTVSLNFERGADLSDTLRKEIVEHGWRVASPEGYPWPLAFDPRIGPRPTTPEELKRSTLIAEALTLKLRAALASKNVAKTAPVMQILKALIDDTVPLPLDKLAGVLSPSFSLSNVRRVMLILDAMKALDPATAVPSADVVHWMMHHGVPTSDLLAQQKEMRRRDRSVEVTDDNKWFVDEKKHEKTLLKIRRAAYERLAHLS